MIQLVGEDFKILITSMLQKMNCIIGKPDCTPDQRKEQAHLTREKKARRFLLLFQALYQTMKTKNKKEKKRKMFRMKNGLNTSHGCIMCKDMKKVYDKIQVSSLKNWFTTSPDIGKIESITSACIAKLPFILEGAVLHIEVL